MSELGPVGMVLIGMVIILVASGVLAGTQAAIGAPLLAFALLAYAVKMTEFDPGYVMSKLQPDPKRIFGMIAFWGILVGCLLVGTIALAQFGKVTLPIDTDAYMQGGVVAAGVGVIASMLKLGRKE